MMSRAWYGGEENKLSKCNNGEFFCAFSSQDKDNIIKINSFGS